LTLPRFRVAKNGGFSQQMQRWLHLHGHCQDASTRSNLLPCDTGIAATCLILRFPSPSQRQFGTLLILPLLARLVVSQLASGSSLRGFRRTRMIRHVDGDSYSRFKFIGKLTAVKTARWLFHPDLKDRGYQAYRVCLVSSRIPLPSGMGECQLS
jgi:hypothetical protein